ncbi:MAG: integrase arm-type DNA-binding domain-containing protein [Xanthobacteraceae bacterium]
MAWATGRLTALKVEKAKEPGMYADGGGLYLRITPQGTKNWVLRYMLNRTPHWMGLGPLALYGLQEARARALDARRKRHDGIDPIKARRAERARQQLDAAKAITFAEVAEVYITAHKAGWRNGKHKTQWENTLKTHAAPIMSLPVQSIDTALVLKVLEPIWTAKPETAGRVRQRIESILDFAKVREYRDSDNPARWRGHLDKLLPARAKVRAIAHHAALSYTELAAFLASLRTREAIAAHALEFLILTAARTGEVIGARWNEVDLLDKIWTVPAARMKAHREHRVPLSPRALAILAEMQPARKGDDGAYVFPGPRSGMPLSNMAFLMLLRRMGLDDLTVHGFRSTFRDWAAKRTNYPNHVVEMALAHAVSDKVEQAYRRGDLFEKRRRLMQQWATFCSTPPAQGKEGNVASIWQVVKAG